MRTHDAYLEEQRRADPEFDREFAEAKAELLLAMALADRRDRLGLTQADVADSMGVAQPAVARYERAGRTPSVVTLWRFCNALGACITLHPGYGVEVLAESSFISSQSRQPSEAAGHAAADVPSVELSISSDARSESKANVPDTTDAATTEASKPRSRRSRKYTT